MIINFLKQTNCPPSQKLGFFWLCQRAQQGHGLWAIVRTAFAAIFVMGICMGQASASVPATPTNLTATPSNNGVYLQWVDNDDTTTSYNIYMGTTSGGEGSSPVQSTYTAHRLVTGLMSLKTYYFKVTAVNSFGQSLRSNETSAAPIPMTTLHIFGDFSVDNDGSNPYAGLIQASDGNFYGTTQYGGSTVATDPNGYGYGTVFRMDVSGQVTILHSFADGTVTNDGSQPSAGLIQASDGNFYGTTQYRGSTVATDPNHRGYGTVYRMDTAGHVTILHNFTGETASDGANPVAGLKQGSDGNLYGTTQYGGSANLGVVFKMDTSGHMTILHSFGDGSVTNDGLQPYAGLIQASDGKLYGTTSQGGGGGEGTVFRTDTSGNVIILHSFGDGTVVHDGFQPCAGLIQATDGNLYGTTRHGGSTVNGLNDTGEGTVFRMDVSGHVTILHSFADGSVENDGYLPYAGLIQASDGKLYGTTSDGGLYYFANVYLNGVVYQIDTSGNMIILHMFGDNSVTADGSVPYAGLIQAHDGKFYGTTSKGGYNNGNVYQFDMGLTLSTPPSPTNLIAVPGDASVTLNWNSSTAATSYNVKRSSTNGGPYTTVSSPTSTSYTNTGLTNGTTYYFVVSAVSGGGESANSTQASAKPNVSVPAIPTGLTATSGNAQVLLSWGASTGATSYNVKRSTTSGGPYATVASPTATSFTSTGLTNGATYYFVVSAVNGGGESANSSQVSAKPTISIPVVPTSLTATPGNSQVSLSWTASTGATSYHVKRSTVGGGPYTTISSPTVTSFTNTGLTNGATYYYVVSAVNGAGESANSVQVSAKPQLPALPITPTSLTATPGNAFVSLFWTASSGATSYHVKRSTVGGGPYTTVASPAAPSFTNTGLVNGTTYYYVVSAVNGGGESANSTQVSAKPLASIVSSPVIDFNGDGKSDLILQNGTTNQIALWYMNGPVLFGGAYVSSTPASVWSAVSEGDFNGDGKPDLVLQNSTSNVIALWYLNGATLTGGAYVGTTPGPAWKVVGSGDFNGDGKRDLVLQNASTNQVQVWFLNGTAVTGTANLSSTPPSGWRVVAVGDFNSDGKPDLALQNATTRQIALWYLNGTTLATGGYVSVVPGVGWKVAGVGDFNADGKLDLVLQNASSNQIALWYLNGLTLLGGAYTSATPGSLWKVVGPR